MSLTSSFRELLLSLSDVMTRPTFHTLVVLLTGWVFASRRTVMGMIQAAAAVRVKHHSAFHRVFASARWSLDAMGLAVFRLVLRWLPEDRPVFLAVDDTLARKRGLKIFGVGMHYDPILSSRGKDIVNWGHNWVVLGVLVRLPFRDDYWFSLPVLFRLYRRRQTVQHEGGAYRTRPELAVEMLEKLCNVHGTRRFHLLADSTYSGKSVVRHLPANCDLTGRMHLDAELFDLPPERRPKAMGRPLRRGPRRPSPRSMLEMAGKRLALDIYGRRETARVVSSIALWHRTAAERPLRVVAVEPLSSGRKVQAFYSTCVDATAEQVLTWYARRWAIEVAFHDAKGHLGFEEPQGWTKRAVKRTAPMAMLLYSLIILWFADHGHRHLCFPHRPWYARKKSVAFIDMLSTLRRQSLRETFISPSQKPTPTQKTLESLIGFTTWAA